MSQYSNLSTTQMNQNIDTVTAIVHWKIKQKTKQKQNKNKNKISLGYF